MSVTQDPPLGFSSAWRKRAMSASGSSPFPGVDAIERLPAHKEETQRDAQSDLPGQLEFARQPLFVLPYDLYVVVGEANCTHPER